MTKDLNRGISSVTYNLLKMQEGDFSAIDGLSSQYAQYYGFMLGKRRLMTGYIRK